MNGDRALTLVPYPTMELAQGGRDGAVIGRASTVSGDTTASRAVTRIGTRGPRKRLVAVTACALGDHAYMLPCNG